MTLNLSYSYSPCPDCDGTGADPNDDDRNCESCDGDGVIGTRRPTLEIAESHIHSAERYFDKADGDGDNAYFFDLAQTHMAVAQTYFAQAQAEQMTRIADTLEALSSRDELAESVRIFGSNQ